MSIRGSTESLRSAWLKAVASTALAASPALLLLAGRAPWEWLAPFLGRFHPVVLHFPIALLLLAAMLETIQVASRGRWTFPLRLVLFLAGISAVTAAALGWLLMRADEVEGALAERHQQGGVALAILSLLTLFMHLAPRSRENRSLRYACRGLLLATCAVLLRTAHDGASLTHGEDYLLEYAPWREPYAPPPFAFPTGQPILEWDVYAHVVTPILQARCYECHGARNVKGGLELDTWAVLQRGGKSGAAIVAGEPDESLLLQRIDLPLVHQDHMPPRRRPQVSPGEKALLRRWIMLGAPAQGTLASVDFSNRLLSVVSQMPEGLRSDAAPGPDAAEKEIDPAEVAKLRADLATIVAALQAKYPFVLSYESRQSAGLHLNAGLLGEKFADDDLAAFGPVRGEIVRADLTGTAITDGAAGAIAAMKRLRVLRVGGTEVTDAFVKALGPLGQLESLSVYGTAITAAAVPQLERMGRLKKIYVGGTKITREHGSAASLREKLIFAHLAAPDPAPGMSAVETPQPLPDAGK